MVPQWSIYDYTKCHFCYRSVLMGSHQLYQSITNGWSDQSNQLSIIQHIDVDITCLFSIFKYAVCKTCMEWIFVRESWNIRLFLYTDWKNNIMFKSMCNWLIQPAFNYGYNICLMDLGKKIISKLQVAQNGKR